MAADLGITNIFKVKNTVYMATNMSKKAFKLMRDSIGSDVQRNCLSFDGSHIKVFFFFLISRNATAKCNFTFKYESDFLLLN